MKTVVTITLLVFALCALAQDSLPTQEQAITTHTPKWELRGYVKQLNALALDPQLQYAASTALLHNRINLRWIPNEKWSAALELRNRLLWGDELRQIPDYANLLRNNSEWANLQKAWVNQPGMILHTNVERFWLQWQTHRLTVRAGRQRINWGVTTNWNPNDLFNTFNFLDFDYEERPGADAVSLQYQLKGDADLELAVSGNGHADGQVMALRYHYNRAAYDYYLLTGWFRNQPTLGAGWAGSINDAGFKGELQWFPATAGASAQLNLAVELDYVFKKGWYFNTGLLYTSSGTINEIDNLNLPLFRFTPKNLMPTRWNVAATGMKEISPLFTATCTIIYAPGTDLLLLLPSLRYSLAQNFDADFFCQSFLAGQQSRLRAQGTRGFLRIRWSF